MFTQERKSAWYSALSRAAADGRIDEDEALELAGTIGALAASEESREHISPERVEALLARLRAIGVIQEGPLD